MCSYECLHVVIDAFEFLSIDKFNRCDDFYNGVSVCIYCHGCGNSLFIPDECRMHDFCPEKYWLETCSARDFAKSYRVQYRAFPTDSMWDRAERMGTNYPELTGSVIAVAVTRMQEGPA